MITLKIIDKTENVKFKVSNDNINVVYDGEYSKGDKIVAELSGITFLKMKLDDTMTESVVYCPDKYFEFEVPWDAFKNMYADDAFSGDKHRLIMTKISDEEFYGYRQISLNAFDTQQSRCFPHAKANFVTNNDPRFCERNAIDGIIDNSSHGYYPYHSWAGGAREDLDYWIYFGADVEVDKITFYLRADFPHDTYWKSLDVELSDGSTVSANFEGISDAQTITFDKHTTNYIHLTNFKQATVPLSWAALTQIQVFGNYIKKNLSE